MNVLFLDDDLHRCVKFRARFPYATTATNATYAITFLAHHAWDLVILDYDLDPDTEPCMEIVRYVAEHRPTVAEFIVHSLDHPAAAEMVAILREAGYLANAFPFTSFNGKFF